MFFPNNKANINNRQVIVDVIKISRFKFKSFKRGSLWHWHSFIYSMPGWRTSRSQSDCWLC